MKEEDDFAELAARKLGFCPTCGYKSCVKVGGTEKCHGHNPNGSNFSAPPQPASEEPGARHKVHETRWSLLSARVAGMAVSKDETSRMLGKAVLIQMDKIEKQIPRDALTPPVPESELDIITTGYMHQGPHTDKELLKSLRGWAVYPDPGEGMVKVMIVKIGEK